MTANLTSNPRPRTLLALKPVTHLLGSRTHTRRSSLSPRTSVRKPKRFPATVHRATLETLGPLGFGAVGCPELQLLDTLAARLPWTSGPPPFPETWHPPASLTSDQASVASSSEVLGRIPPHRPHLGPYRVLFINLCPVWVDLLGSDANEEAG